MTCETKLILMAEAVEFFKSQHDGEKPAVVMHHKDYDVLDEYLRKTTSDPTRLCDTCDCAGIMVCDDEALIGRFAVMSRKTEFFKSMLNL